MTALGDIKTELDQTSSVIAQFRTSVSQGEIIDLTGLDQKIEGMCNAIVDLPDEQRDTVKATLIGLIDDLNTLVDMLTQQQQKVSEGLKGVTSREKAVSAYGKGLNNSKSDKKDPAT
jgi:hypothetical protein